MSEYWKKKLDMSDEEFVSVLTELMGDPLSRRYVQRIENTQDNKIYTAEDVLGERIFRLTGLAALEHFQPGAVICASRPDIPKDRVLFGMTLIGLSAVPHLWTEEVRAALRSVELPRHVLSPRVLPSERTWHTFETGIELGGVLEYNGRTYVDGTCDAILVADAGRGGMEIFQFGEMQDSETGEATPLVASGLIEYGSTYPDDFENDHMRPLVESVLTMLTFLNSPYIPKEQKRVGRAARREAMRMGSPLEEASEYVTFVVLRRPEHKRHKNEEEQSVDWKHRWIVNGHVRAQWYPSEQAHRLIWIAPYVKGPEDAPMLTHAYKVAR